MDSYSGRRRDDPEDAEYGDDLFDEEFFDPEDIPMPSKDNRDMEKYMEKKEKKRRQKKRRKERHDKYHDGREDDY